MSQHRRADSNCLVAANVINRSASFAAIARKLNSSRRLNLDVPIVVAIFAGIITSSHGVFNISGGVYFDSLSMLVFLLLASRFVLKGIQTKQLQFTGLEDELLLTAVSRLLSNGHSERTSSLSLLAGDLISVDNGNVVPIDGTMTGGHLA